MDFRVAFDCDGVIFDSNHMKTEAFQAILSGYDNDVVERFIAFQQTAFGTSRYLLISKFFKDFLARSPRRGEDELLLRAFGEQCATEYALQPLTPGVRDALERLAAKDVDMAVVSGSDQEELRTVFSSRGLAGFFSAILGSPTAKADHLAHVKDLAPQRLIYVGDSVFDFAAADAHGIRFVGMATYSADKAGLRSLQRRHGFSMIAELSDLPDLLDGMAS